MDRDKMGLLGFDKLLCVSPDSVYSVCVNALNRNTVSRRKTTLS
jgi:hypothetical protein